MIKVLLVDDEIQVRQNISLIVDWSLHGYELLTGENGKVAIEILKSTKIDIVLLDITMPIMDGFAVLDWIKGSAYQCKVLILSCHDEFEYVKKALQYNCCDYILKNSISSANILEILHKMRLDISIDESKHAELAQLHVIADRKEYADIRATAIRLLQRTDNYADLESYLFSKKILSENKPLHILARIQINDPQTVLTRFSHSADTFWERRIDDILQTELKGFQYFSFTQEILHTFILFSFPRATDSQKYIMQTQLLLGKVQSAVQHTLDISCAIFYSPVFNSCKDMYPIAGQLALVQAQQFFYSINAVQCLCEFQFDEKVQEESFHQLRIEINHSLESKHFGMLELILDQFVAKIQQEKQLILPSRFIQVLINAIIVFFYAKKDRKQSEIHFSSEHIQELKKELTALLNMQSSSGMSENKKYIVKKTMLYIQNNYGGKLYLDEIADYVGVNPAYLSRVFSQEIGVALVTYINNYRVEIAKRLIETSNLKFYEIAEKTGFSSSISFSSLFKKITGKTPGEYKNSCTL